MKKIALMFVLALLLQSKVFPQFEINFSVPLGLSFISPYVEGSSSNMVQFIPYTVDYRGIEGSVMPSAGILMQIGGSFDLGNKTGVTSISLLADIGYYALSFKAVFTDVYSSSDISEKHIAFDTLNLGIIPKINIYLSNATPFSIGLGGGIKIPFSGTKYLTARFSQHEEDTEEKMSYKDIKETFEYPFIPYIKFTMDSYFYVSKKVAFTLGGYVSYNFGMQYDVEKRNSDNSEFIVTPIGSGKLNLEKYGYTSFDVGISLGISFGRPDPKPKEEVL